MLAKKYKLSIQGLFSKKNFFTIKSSFFIFRIFKNDLPYSRFGVIVSGKVFKKAVLRNKIKRKVFDFIRKEGICMKEKNKDIAISVLPSFNELVDKEKEEIFLKELRTVIKEYNKKKEGYK